MPATVNNAEKLREWFRSCPVLSAPARFGVDYLAENPTEYAIYSVPSPLAYHNNVLGEEILDDVQTINFIFASKEPFGSDVDQNIDNLGFYAAVVDWILEQNAARNFPVINGGRVRSLVPTLTAYPAETGADAAKYQIQIRLTYRRD